MYSIILTIVVNVAGSAQNVSVSAQQVGLYGSVDTCNLVASKLARKGFVQSEHYKIDTYYTTQCVQVKDKP